MFQATDININKLSTSYIMYNKLRTYKYKNVQYSKCYLTNQCFI